MTDLEKRLEQIRLCAPLLPPPGDRVVDQLVRALVEAMRQRSHGYRYVWDVLSDRQKAEIGQWFERDDAKILALLDGKGET